MSIVDSLPPSLNLPPHLSSHKYFFVCTLTVAAWDSLVLSPRTWRLIKSPGWPPLKILFHVLRVFMPVEFVIVAVAFFDTHWSQQSCQNFYLFEPIATALLLAANSAIHVIRIHAIYDKSRAVLAALGALFAVQVIVTGVASGFYRSVPLLEGQGCIAGPKHTWVGIYWIAPTLLYITSFALALKRSINSLQAKPLSPWKLMLRDGLNLYAAIVLVNLANVIFWFVIKPRDERDTIQTIVTSMAAVLTTAMSLRIVLSVRGSLVAGGAFALSGASQSERSASHHISGSSRTTHVISTRGAVPTAAYTLDDMRSKGEITEWPSSDKVSETEAKPQILDGREDEEEDEAQVQRNPSVGVKITIDREIGYDDVPGYPAK